MESKAGVFFVAQVVLSFLGPLVSLETIPFLQRKNTAYLPFVVKAGFEVAKVRNIAKKGGRFRGSKMVISADRFYSTICWW